MPNLRYLEPAESLGHLDDSAEMLRPTDLSACGTHSEMEERVLPGEEETQLTQPEAIRFAAESEGELLAAENQQLGAEIKTLSKVTTEQIDRMEQAGIRLALLERIRLHAETMVYQRADREIRLQAEIEALRRTEAAQLKRIEEAEAEAQARQRAAAAALQQAEEEVRRLAEEEEQRIEHLETIRRRAEASSHERAEKERLLTSQLLAFGEAADEQLRRIEKMEADLREAEKKALQFDEDARQKSEHEAIRLIETEPRRQAAEEGFRSAGAQAREKVRGEEQTIAQLELIRGATEMKAQQRSETIQPLNAEIEPLGKSEAEQSPRIEETETHLHQMRPEGLQAGVGVEIVSSLAERIRTGDSAERAGAFQQIAKLNDDDAFSLITSLFDDSSAEVRNAAARALYELRPNRTDTFTRALHEASPERRLQITKALVGSGLAAEAIDNLGGEILEETYDAFSMLCLMAKAGEFQSLLQTIEMHPDTPVKLSVIKLLTFCNQPEIIPAFRNLAVRGSLPTEIRSALLASIYALKSKAGENSPSAA